MEILETGIPDERIAGLEKRVRDLEPLIKGLIAELVDLKSVTRTMSKEEAEYSRRESERRPIAWAPGSSGEESEASPGAVSPSGNTVIRPKAAAQPEVPAAPEEPVMAWIMQADGTMKQEPRFGDKNQTSSSAGYGKNQKIRGTRRP